MIRVLAWPGKRVKRNPYCRLLYESVEKQCPNVEVVDFSVIRLLFRRYDIWHMHWPDDILSRRSRIVVMMYLLAVVGMMIYVRALGRKIVWTVHNIRSHDRFHPNLESLLYRFLWHFVDGYIFLSELSRSEYLRDWPETPVEFTFVVPHGDYRSVYADKVDKWEAREQLSIPREAKVVFLFGQLRRYKGVKSLLSVFSEIQDKRCRLLICGAVADEDVGEAVERYVRSDQRILFKGGRIDEGDVPILFGCADAVVLPYTQLTNSGVVFLSLSLERPVIMPESNLARELQREFGEGWVRVYTPPLDSQVILNGATACLPNYLPQFKETRRWPNIARATAEVYGKIQQSGA